MYPRISDLFEDFLGIELPFPIYSFGLMLAIAILTAAWLTARELDRIAEIRGYPCMVVSDNDEGIARSS